MEGVRIKLSGLWAATMLTYLLGDSVRIFAGDFEAGIIEDMEPTQGMWLLIAAIMLVPILMVVLNLTLKYPAIRWLNIILAVFFILFNIIGLPYPGAYDNFLLIVIFGFNLLTIWYAWKWVKQQA